MIQLLIILLVPVGIALQGIIEDRSRALSNVFQYGPIILLGVYGLACLAASVVKEPKRLIGRNPLMPTLFIGFALMTTLSLMASNLATRPGGIRDTLIVGVTLFGVAAPFRWTSRHFHYFVWVQCISFAVLSVIRNGSPTSLNLIEGYSPWEHHTLGFVLPVCFLYAYFEKSIPLMALSGLLSVLAMKRIAIIALIAVLILSVLPLSKKPRVLICLVIGVLMFLVSHYLDLLIEVVQVLWPESKDFRDLFSGRGPLVATVREKAYSETGMAAVIFGNGPGYASKLAVELLSADLKHIHNDYIRIFLDYGIFGSIFWLSVLARLAAISKLTFCLALYQLIVFTTDNTFVYYPHLVAFYLMAKLHDLPLRSESLSSFGLRSPGLPCLAR